MADTTLTYLHPSIVSSIESEESTYQVANGVATAFVADVFEKGEDNKVKLVTSVDEFLLKYGEPNYSKYGQAAYNVIRWLENQGQVYVLRVLPSDAQYSHAVLNIQTKKTTGGKKYKTSNGEIVDLDDVKLRPVISYIKSNNTSTDSLIYEITSSRSEKTVDGYSNNFLMVVYPTGRGSAYNNLGFRLSLNTTYDSFNESRIYNFEVVRFDENSNVSVIEGPYYVSFDPDALDGSNESMYIETVVNRYSEYLKVAFNSDAWERIASIINPDVDPKVIDIITGKTRKKTDGSNETYTYYSEKANEDLDIHISLIKYSSNGEPVYNDGEYVMNLPSYDDIVEQSIISLDNNIREEAASRYENKLAYMKEQFPKVSNKSNYQSQYLNTLYYNNNGNITGEIPSGIKQVTEENVDGKRSLYGSFLDSFDNFAGKDSVVKTNYEANASLNFDLGHAKFDNYYNELLKASRDYKDNIGVIDSGRNEIDSRFVGQTNISKADMIKAYNDFIALLNNKDVNIYYDHFKDIPAIVNNSVTIEVQATEDETLNVVLAFSSDKKLISAEYSSDPSEVFTGENYEKNYLTNLFIAISLVTEIEFINNRNINNIIFDSNNKLLPETERYLASLIEGINEETTDGGGVTSLPQLKDNEYNLIGSLSSDNTRLSLTIGEFTDSEGYNYLFSADIFFNIAKSVYDEINNPDEESGSIEEDTYADYSEENYSECYKNYSYIENKYKDILDSCNKLNAGIDMVTGSDNLNFILEQENIINTLNRADQNSIIAVAHKSNITDIISTINMVSLGNYDGTLLDELLYLNSLIKDEIDYVYNNLLPACYGSYKNINENTIKEFTDSTNANTIIYKYQKNQQQISDINIGYIDNTADNRKVIFDNMGDITSKLNQIIMSALAYNMYSAVEETKNYALAINPFAEVVINNIIRKIDNTENISDLIQDCREAIDMEVSSVVETAGRLYNNNLHDFSNSIKLTMGSDGSFDYDLIEQKTRKNNIKNELIKAYRGQIDTDIINKKLIEFEHVLDCNYDVDIKNAIVSLARDIRGDFFFWADTGIQPSPQDVIEWRRELFNVSSRHVGIFSQDMTFYDAYTGKDIRFTTPYILAQKIPFNALNYGLHYPIAGPRRGLIDGFKSLCWSPNEAYKEQLYTNKVNYIEQDVRRTKIGSQLTTDSRNGPLSNINNVLTILKLQRNVERLVEDYQFEFNDDETRNALYYELNDYVSTYITNKSCESISVEVFASDYDKQQKILRVNLTVKFYDVIERIVINFSVQK